MGKPRAVLAATFLLISIAPAFAQTSGDSAISKPNAPLGTTTNQQSASPSSPGNGTKSQRPADAQTTGSAAPDSGEGRTPLSGDDPTGLKKANPSSK
jgi:hypothetical protein